jgi:hypothetical protein
VTRSSDRPHHIGAVIHHFLGRAEDPAAPADRPAAHRYRFAVAALGEPSLSALTTAGLWRSACGGEGTRPAGPSCGFAEWEPAGWTVQRVLAQAPGPAPAEAAESARVTWIHLGAMSEDRLERLEAAPDRGGCGHGAARWCEGLVWCLAGAEAGTLGAAFTLGRVAAAIRPRRIKILVSLAAEDEEAGADRSWRQELERRCLRQARAVVGRAPLEIVPLPSSLLAAAGETEADWCRSLAQSMMLAAAAART